MINFFGMNVNDKHISDLQVQFVRDMSLNHAKTFGRIYYEMMANSPHLYAQFMEGFYEAYQDGNKED